MKKLCSILLMLSMTVSALAIEVNIDGLWYEIVSKTNEAKVVKYKNNTTYRGDIVIPQTVEYNGESYVVTTIGSEAFYYCSLMTSIIIPNSVTVIDNMAFANCSGLKTLAIPNSVTTIGEKAFAWCNGLITVTIPNSVTSFGDNAFLYCNKLSSVTILDGLKRIGNSAFYGCYDLIDVLLPNSIEAIGDYTFYYCKSIKSIILPNNLRSIGHNAFSKCFSLNSIVMSDSLESLGNNAFAECSSLSSISIPKSLTHIGDYAFNKCNSLSSVQIYDLEAWCRFHFWSNASNPLSYAHHLFLNGIEVKDLVIPENVTKIGDYLFFGCSGLTSVTIPNSITNIGYSAFSGCKGLTSITLHNGIVSTGTNAFNGCSSLTSITIPNSVKSIAQNSFSNCSGLTSIVIPESVTNIGYGAFSGCSNLTRIIIGSAVNTIYAKAFSDCPELMDVYCHAENMPHMENSGSDSFTTIFEGSYIEHATLHVPESSIPVYKTTEPWKNFKEIVKIKPEHTLLYLVDDEIYKSYKIEEESKIEVEEEPTKEGYTFSGWSEIPDSMPAHDVTITGTFTINKYLLTYKVNGEIVKSDSIVYNTVLVPEAEPTKEGYTFSGWSEIPDNMPAHDVTIIGSFIPIIYKLTYQVDGIDYNVYDIAYGSVITPEADPVKEGYTFSGWSEIPDTMPAQDVAVTGTFKINKYLLTYKVDGEVFKSDSIVYNSSLTPIAEPTKEGYTFSGWSAIPETMPAQDVVVTGSFKVNKYLLTYQVDDEIVKSDSIVFNTAITPEAEPTKEGYTFSGWSEIPATMPANDVVITGTFKVNKYLLTYKVDDEIVKSDSIVFNTAITPEAEPTKEGYTFSGWSEIPETMPAHDLTVTGSFTINKYKLTYMIDDKVYKDTVYEYSATIVPEPIPEGNYATFEWTDLPETMPAHDVVVHASYTTGIREMILAKPQDVQIYSPNGKKLNKLQKGLNIVRMSNGKTQKVVMK